MSNSHRILILDDEPKMGALLSRSLERDGYSVTPFQRPHDALEELKRNDYDVLVTDLRMPGLDGLEVLRRAKSISPRTEVILMTAYASVETAREALTCGAVDYLVKPVSAESDLKPLLHRLLDGTEPEAASASKRAAAGTPSGLSRDPVKMAPSKSPAMAKILDKLDRIARSNASVLIRGESGTGKEVLADLIHSKSARAGRPFLKINCGALPETLLESELFGHVKGAFTGAIRDREGLFAAADGGTLLLDEIGEVSPALQVKMLRVLQNGEYQRVGDSGGSRCDVRIVAATNRDLERMIETGEFRQDLYYRLNVVPLEIPPLRERRDDLDELIQFFIRKLCPDQAVVFTESALEALRSYQWPGNIRELENAIEHALVLGEPGNILLDDLPASIQKQKQIRDPMPGSAAGEASLENIEKRCLLNALERTNGNRTRAAALLGITRRTLGYRLRKYDLEDEVARLVQEKGVL